MQQLLLANESNLPVVIALGYFDCIHLGHRALFAHACEMAGTATPAFFTFDNPPFDAIKSTLRPIYDYSTRLMIAESCGMGAVIHAPFDDALKNLSPLAFLEMLFRSCKVQGIVCGKDYTFGQGGQGTANMLQKFAAERGVSVRIVDDVMSEDGVKISSTRIRRAVQEGNISTANKLLGSPYRMTGLVSHGRGDGRDFRTPTANFEYKETLIMPMEGVYATNVRLNEGVFQAVTNVGRKPTFGDDTPTIETYILNYSGDLYGCMIIVEFHRWLRSVRNFASKEDLYEQIKKDIEESLKK